MTYANQAAVLIIRFPDAEASLSRTGLWAPAPVYVHHHRPILNQTPRLPTRIAIVPSCDTSTARPLVACTELPSHCRRESHLQSETHGTN